LKSIRSSNLGWSKNQKVYLDPWFVTGFSDAESCFYLGMTKDSKRKTGWITYLEFKIVLHEKDRALLELIKLFFGGRGSILNGGKGLVKYQVRSIYDLAIIIAHFDKYPLITKKLAAQLRSRLFTFQTSFWNN
jgi:hypothetical protein